MKRGLLIVSLMMGVLVGSSASAADLKNNSVDQVFNLPGTSGPINWGGVYFGAQVGYGLSGHEFGGDDWTLDGIGGHGGFGGGTVGVDFQRGVWVFGAFADYNVSAVESVLSIDNVDVAKIEEGDSWVLAARIGRTIGSDQRAMLYGLAGYGQTDVRYIDDKSHDKTFSGLVLGGGAEFALTQNVFLGLEYQHFFGGKETLINKADGEEGLDYLTDEMDTDKIMGKLKIKLGGIN